jgi:hypothetical protein
MTKLREKGTEQVHGRKFWHVLLKRINKKEKCEYLPSESYSFAILRAREEAISGAWAAGTITTKMASLCSA